MARVLGPTEYKAAARATRAPTRELHSDRQQSPSTTPDPETPMPLDEKSPIQGRDPARKRWEGEGYPGGGLALSDPHPPVAAQRVPPSPALAGEGLRGAGWVVVALGP